MQVHGKQLIVSGNLNYETEPKVNIEISVTDSGNPPLSYQKSFAITITDVNDAPSDIIFTLYPVMENNTVNQMVTNLTLADEDFNQHVQYCSMIKTPGYFYLVTDSVENAVNVFIQGTAPLDYEVSPVFNGRRSSKFCLNGINMIGFLLDLYAAIHICLTIVRLCCLYYTAIAYSILIASISTAVLCFLGKHSVADSLESESNIYAIFLCQQQPLL